MATLKARLVLIGSLLAIALVVVGTTGYVSLQTVSNTYSHVAEINLPNATLLQEMSFATGSSIRQMVRLGYSNISAEEIGKLSDRYQDFFNTYSVSDKKYQSVPFVEGEAEVYERVSKSWNQAHSIAQSMIELRKKGDIEGYLKVLDGDYRTQYNLHGKALEDLIQFQSAQGNLWANRATAHLSQPTTGEQFD